MRELIGEPVSHPSHWHDARVDIRHYSRSCVFRLSLSAQQVRSLSARYAIKQINRDGPS
jgi:hypothetical protein